MNNHNIEPQQLPVLPVLSLATALARKLPPIDYVLPGLPRGKVGMLSAAGGVGKSYWSLQAALQVAVGGFVDFDLAGAEFESGDATGSVLLVSLEDEADDVSRRLQTIINHWEDDKEQKEWLADIADNELFDIIALAGQGVSLIDNYAMPNGYIASITEHAQKMHHCRLIIIDTLRRAHDADENDNGVMSKILRYFEKLAKDTNAAVLLLHHESKAAIGNADAGAGAMRGASAIVDNARWVMRMQRMTAIEAEARGILDDNIRKQWIRVTNEKTNYGPEEAEKWLLRGYGGVLSKSTPPVKVDNAAKTKTGRRRSV
ncbi:MAG: AAA family ATPase [Methylomarinum sp.]|nr:AAA family ATPase [Methylomarinum sp.]